MNFVPLSELPKPAQEFVTTLCISRNLAIPKFGIIDDGAPQAFTNCYVPGNARIILSSGLFDLLEEEELNAVIAYALG